MIDSALRKSATASGRVGAASTTGRYDVQASEGPKRRYTRFESQNSTDKQEDDTGVDRSTIISRKKVSHAAETGR